MPAPFPDFAVACGEEASDPLVVHDGREVRVDELASSGHLDQQDADLAAVADLGVGVWRYGMPWRLAEPAPGEYDWTLWDRALAACDRHGLTPVVDLCHFGLPDHYPGFCDPTWVEGFCRYVDAFLRRYPEPAWFTPVNEPAVTALLSALLGFWNDRRSSTADHGTALANVVLADLEALARIDADRGGWWVGAEGFSAHVVDEGDDAGEAAAAEDRAVEQAVWDLHFGVELAPEVAGLVDAVDNRVLTRLADLAVSHERVVAGHDLYPTSVRAYGTAADRPLTIQDRVTAYEDEARRWHDRYGRPFWVAETSNLGLPVEQQVEWLDALVAGLHRLGADGLPVRGVCWYSRGDQYDWDSALTAPVGKVTTVGLFDADRSPRPVADRYRQLARRHPLA